MNNFFVHNIQKIIIYGELCGGEYPHPEVEKLPQYQAIQTGVYYSNDIHFFVFDIRIFTEKSIFYLDYKDFFDFLPKTNFLTAPFYLVDKLHKILQFDLDKNTPIPSLLGLPALSTPNFIEGIVIKPYQHSLLGEENEENPRPIFKLKRKEFLENPVYQEAKKWENINVSENTWQDVDFWVVEISPYLNKNRLESTISKLGNSKNPTSEQTKKLAVHWANDALESFVEDYPVIWAEILPKTQENIRQKIVFEAIFKLLSDK
jgi:Rnl2 family RNA ligase